MLSTGYAHEHVPDSAIADYIESQACWRGPNSYGSSRRSTAMGSIAGKVELKVKYMQARLLAVPSTGDISLP